MKRKEIEVLIAEAGECFAGNGWTLPPNVRWDVTDFGLGDWQRFGLVLVNLAEEPEYCEKIMYARDGMTTPAHCHRLKKEDIICRWGRLRIQIWPGVPGESEAPVTVNMNGEPRRMGAGEFIELSAGERITLVPGVYHEFAPISPQCIIGEVSTANDDANDNFFANPDVGRFPVVED